MNVNNFEIFLKNAGTIKTLKAQKSRVTKAKAAEAYLSTNLDADYVKYTSSLSAYKSAYGTSVEDTSDTRSLPFVLGSVLYLVP